MTHADQNGMRNSCCTHAIADSLIPPSEEGQAGDTDKWVAIQAQLPSGMFKVPRDELAEAVMAEHGQRAMQVMPHAQRRAARAHAHAYSVAD